MVRNKSMNEEVLQKCRNAHASTFQVQVRAQRAKNVTCPSLVLCIYEAL